MKLSENHPRFDERFLETLVERRREKIRREKKKERKEKREKRKNHFFRSVLKAGPLFFTNLDGTEGGEAEEREPEEAREEGGSLGGLRRREVGGWVHSHPIFE